jgi:hypothetical protein
LTRGHRADQAFDVRPPPLGPRLYLRTVVRLGLLHQKCLSRLIPFRVQSQRLQPCPPAAAHLAAARMHPRLLHEAGGVCGCHRGHPHHDRRVAPGGRYIQRITGTTGVWFLFVMYLSAFKVLLLRVPPPLPYVATGFACVYGAREFQQSMLCYVLQSRYRPMFLKTSTSQLAFVCQSEWFGKNDLHIISLL